MFPSLGEVGTETLRWEGAKCGRGMIEGLCHWRRVNTVGEEVTRDEVTEGRKGLDYIEACRLW